MLREKQQELIKKLRQAKTIAEEDEIKLEIDKIEEEFYEN